MNSHFRNPITHGLDITRISHLESIDSCLNSGPGVDVTQFEQPFRKSFGLPDFNQVKCIPLATIFARVAYASTISTFVSIKFFGIRAGK